jgi:hypothetical protein
MHTIKGSSLFEIIISLFILSLLFLGMDAAQFASLRQAKYAYYVSVATAQLKVMSERLRMLKGQDWHEQITHWNAQNTLLLPQGRGELRGHYPAYVLSLFWGSKPPSVCDKQQIGPSGCLYVELNL